MTKEIQPSRLAEALIETADDMRRAGVMDEATHRKITLRHLGTGAASADEPMGGHQDQPGKRVRAVGLGDALLLEVERHRDGELVAGQRRARQRQPFEGFEQVVGAAPDVDDTGGGEARRVEHQPPPPRCGTSQRR